jgi:membrane protease YdiL (CAAX protease family)
MDRLRRHPVAAFFVLAYAINIAACGIGWLVHAAVPGTSVVPAWIVGVFSPTVAGLTMAWVVGRGPGVRRLLAALTRWRFPVRWFLLGMSFTLLPLAIAVGYTALGNPVEGLEPGLTLPVALGALAYTLVVGPISEEPGWRGFALPRLEERHSALGASLILGTAWAFWHVPFYFLPNQVMIPFPIFVPQCIALAIIFTAIYNNTGGSVLATINAHFWFNFSGAWVAGHLGLMPPMLLYVMGGLGALVLVVIVVAVEGPARLSRRPVSELPFPAGA